MMSQNIDNGTVEKNPRVVVVDNVSHNLNKKELKKAFEAGLIDSETFKQKLFEIETAPKDKKRKERRFPKSLTPEEFIKLIKATPENDRIARTSFLLAYASGLRISEIVGGGGKDSGNIIPPLSTENFMLDLKPPQMKVYGKYSKERIVPIPKGWRDYMTKLLPIKKTARTLERKFKKYAKKAGLDSKYTFHSLRHGFATRLMESGVPPTHVQYLMGHDNLQTTSIYSQARPLDALKSYEDNF